MSFPSLLLDQLGAHGLPMQYASNLGKLFTGDIITLGLRLALIGLLAALVRSRVVHYKHMAERGKSIEVSITALLMTELSSRQPMCRGAPSPGSLRTWPTVPKPKGSSGTTESLPMKSWRTELQRSRTPRTESSSRVHGHKAAYALLSYPTSVSLGQTPALGGV
jgi:hypothetical protein